MIISLRTAAWALLLPLGRADATTPQEMSVLKAPQPHVVYSGGSAVPVHRVQRQGYFGGQQGNAAALAKLKDEVRHCTKSLANSHNALHPPTSWPDWVLIAREDQYTTATRQITYSSGTSHTVSYTDCSLLSVPYSKALLASSKGVCTIDLVSKTATGECDAGGHADAVTERRAAQPPAELLKRLEANPALAAAMPQMRQAMGMLAVRGPQRTVLGVRCNVWTQPIDSAGTKATLCYAIGGSFLPLRAVDKDGFGGLLLESATPGGFDMAAVDARLDTKVGNDVFAPYARGGFAINANRGEP